MAVKDIVIQVNIHCHEVTFLALVGVASHKVQEAGRGKGAHLQ